MPNRLIKEKSPYLLQHAENPVDWYPWSGEAFDKAAREDKPVFLSVGYATCHWCHVMAHESFEDNQVADLMNEAFVNIKVDREERPDIDHTYMTVCQLLTGHGGWPLTIIMTPGKEPFFAATYIPKTKRFNQIGMLELIPRITLAWKDERQELMQSAEKIREGFDKTRRQPRGSRQPDAGFIKSAKAALEGRFDSTEGGFGTKPKFPSPHNLNFLLQYSRSFDDPAALRMAELTLEKMRLGGIYDQVGFGFHRYSTDKRWLLPHFEKMLYDQALLMFAYTEGWRSAQDPLFRQTVFEIAEYVSEQLTSDEGGFYSAEDADSEGEEGKFYVWKADEIEELLLPEEAELFREIYNLEPEGNFLDEATGRKTGVNIPCLEKRVNQLAKERNRDPDKLQNQLENIRIKVKKKRAQRIRPLLDDKILTDWNGLMIAAFSRAGALFESDSFIHSAEKSWKFISDKLIDSDDRLLHRYRDGEAAFRAMADDYAFLIWGLIELYQSTHKTEYLSRSLEINRQFMDQCWDNERGGVYFTGKGSEKLLGRQKEIYDGAIPSSNSVTAMNLLRLARLTGKPELEEKADKLFSAFSSFLKRSPDGAVHAMHALIMAVKPSAEIVICGSRSDPEVRKMIRTVRLEMNEPYVLLLKTDENAKRLAELAPYTRAFLNESRPAAYLCRQFNCETPVYSADALTERITERTNH